MTQPRILIIEDDEQIKEVIEETLCSLQWEYDWATNQQNALDLVQSKDYVAVLLDLEIPARPLKGNANIEYGCNCLEHIRKLKDQKVLPVIVMTTHTEKGFGLAQRLFHKGANDSISKPFGRGDRTLIQVLQDNIRTPRLEGQAEMRQFQGGELVIYPNRITLQGIEILGKRAIPSEIKVLRFLAEKRDGQYIKVSGGKLAKSVGVEDAKKISDMVRVIREAASKNLNEHHIDCGKYDVIPDTDGRGYCIKDWIDIKMENQDTPVPTNEASEAKSNKDVREQWIYRELVLDGQEWTTADMAKKLECSKKTISRILKPLELQGQIKRVGKDTWKRK